MVKTSPEFKKFRQVRAKDRFERWKDLQFRAKMERTLKTRLNTKEAKEKMMRGQQSLKNELLAIAELFCDEGYRAFPLHHGHPVPDVIAIKDGKVFAIELIRDVRRISNKYDNYPYYDDIIWIVRPKT